MGYEEKGGEEPSRMSRSIGFSHNTEFHGRKRYALILPGGSHGPECYVTSEQSDFKKIQMNEMERPLIDSSQETGFPKSQRGRWTVEARADDILRFKREGNLRSFEVVDFIVAGLWCCDINMRTKSPYVHFCS